VSNSARAKNILFIKIKTAVKIGGFKNLELEGLPVFASQLVRIHGIFYYFQRTFQNNKQTAKTINVVGIQSGRDILGHCLGLLGLRRSFTIQLGRKLGRLIFVLSVDFFIAFFVHTILLF